MKESGLAIMGEIRGVGTSKSNKPFIQLELNDNGRVSLVRVSTKSNGQKIGDPYNARVMPMVFDGQFYGFREV